MKQSFIFRTSLKRERPFYHICIEHVFNGRMPKKKRTSSQNEWILCHLLIGTDELCQKLPSIYTLRY